MAKTNAKQNGTKANGSGAKSFEAQVASVLTTLSALVTSVKALGLPVLTEEERLHTAGKLRVGEPAAITAVFDTVDAFPQYFDTLANQDNGTDPDTVETQPARTGLATAESLQPIIPMLAELQTMVSDGIFANADIAKALSVPAYAIGKTLSKTNPKLRTSLAPAISFYGAPGLKRAAKNVRTANKTKRAAKGAKTTNA
jgi:hypothetical protein